MSLKDIASMAGVSVSTASRVLNGTSPSCASRSTQDKIWEAARKTGYVPNEAARKLRKTGEKDDKTLKVTIIFARIKAPETDPFFEELLRYLEAELLKKNILTDEIIYAGSSLTVDLSGADGIIILGRCSEDLLRHITSQNENVVGIWRNPLDFDVDEVVCDGEKAAELAMRHLLDLGHRKIAYIGDCSYESRYVGYCNMMIRNHIALNYELVKRTDQTAEEAEKAFKELLAGKASGRADFTAVFCANDMSAIRVLEVLGKEKKPIRRSVSVISIDDIEESQDTKPFLTTIRIPRDEMAHMAVDFLTDRINGGHREHLRIEFPCRLVSRESCYVI